MDVVALARAMAARNDPGPESADVKTVAVFDTCATTDVFEAQTTKPSKRAMETADTRRSMAILLPLAWTDARAAALVGRSRTTAVCRVCNACGNIAAERT